MSIFKFNTAQPDSLAQLIGQIPAWTTGYDSIKTVKLIAVARMISGQPGHMLRVAIKTFVSETAGESNFIDELSKVYLLLRVLFELPDTIERSKAQVFGGWIHPSVENSSGDFNLTWPVLVSGPLFKSKIEVTGKFKGYKGRPYDAVGEFDYFTSNFRQRRL